MKVLPRLVASTFSATCFLVAAAAGSQPPPVQLGAPAVAQPALPGAIGSPPGTLSTVGPPPLPPEQTQGAVAFRHGGVGDDQDEAMRSIRARYSLVLEFAGHDRQWGNVHLANVRVALADRDGRVVLSTLAEGPWLMARVPPGRYTITAEHEGRRLTRTTQVPTSGSRHVVLRWDDAS